PVPGGPLAVPPPRKRRQIEREFGVPIAGEVLDPARWTQTALKRLPARGPLDLPGLFGRSAPLVVDLGCGNGRFLIGSAAGRPGPAHLGTAGRRVAPRSPPGRATRRGLSNVRFAVVDAERLVAEYLPPGGVAEAHCYPPQPYYDPAEVHRRLVTP